jgi:hypothetical protein
MRGTVGEHASQTLGNQVFAVYCHHVPSRRPSGKNPAGREDYYPEACDWRGQTGIMRNA